MNIIAFQIKVWLGNWDRFQVSACSFSITIKEIRNETGSDAKARKPSVTRHSTSIERDATGSSSFHCSA